jgi:hypothetical protein
MKDKDIGIPLETSVEVAHTLVNAGFLRRLEDLEKQVETLAYAVVGCCVFILYLLRELRDFPEVK